jgi:hypothetical protein
VKVLWPARRGTWSGIFGFAVILLIEHFTHMVTVSHATGILLLSILGGTILTNRFSAGASC